VPDYLAVLDAPVRGMRIGVPENYYFDELHFEVDHAVREAITSLGGLGARVETLRVPDPELLVAACNNKMVSAEAASIHSRILKERPGELQPAVLARLAPGLRVSAYDYIQGSRLRAQLTREFIADVFSKVDVLVAPTIPEPAPTLAGAKSGTTEDVVRRMGQFSRLTRPFNALGLPVLSVPCGVSSDGLPISLQVIGRPFDEISVLRLGQAYEQATRWHMREPKLD
jgi:aspartyl-tRNA(Asn)/glutamyl-tRNA(Gln) amidotransferase subunit A